MRVSRWQRKTRDCLYSDPWIRLYSDIVVRHDGTEGPYGVLGTKGGIGVVAVDSERYVYLVAQYRYPSDVYSLEIPKGARDSFDSAEEALDAAKRELSEETGIRAQVWDTLGTVNTLMGYSNDIVNLFLATELISGESHPEACEDIRVIRWPLGPAMSLMTDGLEIDGQSFKMYDATSVAALALARDKLRDSSNESQS